MSVLSEDFICLELAGFKRVTLNAGEKKKEKSRGFYAQADVLDLD